MIERNFGNAGSSSMEIGIKVIAENIQNRVERHVNSCLFTMVAVDKEKKPAAVMPLQPGTPDEIRRYGAAIVRKERRCEMEQRFTATRTAVP